MAESKHPVKFVVDVFEEQILKDMGFDNKYLLRKLKRNMTDDFVDWVKDKIDHKEPVLVNLKGGTRTGKSLGGLMIAYLITRRYSRDFDVKKIVCANQGEFMTKLHKVEFGDVLQMDEKLFGEVGEGAYAMESQLANVGNVTAKFNIHTISITPKKFISNNASLGLQTWGRDTKNWFSRYILFDLRGATPIMLGYVIIDIKPLFTDFGCTVFEKCGGCPNPLEYTNNLEGLKNDFHRAITLEEEKLLIFDKKSSCPFYNICELPMCVYEHKKDLWIDDELKGGLSYRKREVIKSALLLLEYCCVFHENTIKYNVKNKGQTKELAKLMLDKVTNIKPTIQELEAILVNMDLAISNETLFEEMCKKTELDKSEILSKIPIKD